MWDTWNAKSPLAQRDDALAADAALLARIEAVPPGERNAFSSAMGPMTLGFAQFVGMRLNEHAFHTWDIEVVANPAATIPVPVAALVVDNLGLVARFTGKPTGDTTTITVATTGPERGFTVELASDGANARNDRAHPVMRRVAHVEPEDIRPSLHQRSQHFRRFCGGPERADDFRFAHADL